MNTTRFFYSFCVFAAILVFFQVRAFSAVQFISRSFSVYLCSSCQVFSFHVMHRASLVIFALVLRCDSQSFRPVQSFILFGLFARPSYSSNLAIVLQVFCLFYLLFLQFAVLLSLGFAVILSSLCIFLIFVFQYRFGLFQIACHRFVSVVERLDSTNRSDDQSVQTPRLHLPSLTFCLYVIPCSKRNYYDFCYCLGCCMCQKGS